jgi:hypothetical protein
VVVGLGRAERAIEAGMVIPIVVALARDELDSEESGGTRWRVRLRALELHTEFT